MKILAFVDMHGSNKALEKIKDRAKDVDIIVCAGDLTIFENEMEKLMMQLNKLKKPVLMIPGNHEDEQDLSQLCRVFDNITDINEKSFVFGEHIFFGYGGGGFSMVDSHFDKLSKKFIKEIDKDKKVVLVTHAPPYKTKIDKIIDEHCGNKGIKNFILKVKPVLAISGHLHENAGKEDKVMGSKVINPGPFGKIISL